MRSDLYSKDELLLAVAKKKPRLQALIDRVAEMSAEEITALGEPLWVRQALEILRQSNGKGMKERLRDILDAADKADAIERAKPKPTYEIRIWDGAETFLGSNNGNKDWQIQVENQDSFMIVDDEYVRFGDSMVYIGPFDRYPLMAGSKMVGYMTLDQYKGFHRALLNQKYKHL